MPLTLLKYIPSLILKNLNILKYIAIALIVGALFWKVYSFYDNYQTLIQDKIDLTKELSNTKETLQEFKAVAKHNEEMLNYEKKRNTEIQNELKIKHKNELEKIKKITIIKEKTYHEEDGPIAPVLSNTINRLFTKD